MSGGVRMFKRHKSDVDAYRIVSDGVQALAPFMGPEKKVGVTHARFVEMLQADLPLDRFDRPLADEGCYVVEVLDGVLKGCCYSAWRGKKTLALLIGKQDLQALAFLLKLDHTKAPKQEKADEVDKEPKTE